MTASTLMLVPLIQLMLAAFLGMILGIERIMAGRTAGPRTYVLVSLGACLLTMLSLQVAQMYPTQSKADPIGIVSATISGIGFIGAGLIIFKGSKLSGLTTAAGIWVAAAIGIAVGFKFYMIASFVTLLVLFIFTVMWHFEHYIKILYKNTKRHHHPDDKDMV